MSQCIVIVRFDHRDRQGTVTLVTPPERALDSFVELVAKFDGDEAYLIGPSDLTPEGWSKRTEPWKWKKEDLDD